MKYIQVDIETKKEELEQVTGLLLTLGITDTVVEDPDDICGLLNKAEDYDWDYISPQVLEKQNEVPKITFYMDEKDGSLTESIVASVKESFSSASVKVSVSDDSDWKDKWKEFFKPAKITDKLVVKPTWEEYQPEPGEKIIEIDPGMAFGTGTHETTSLCMKLMEKYIGNDDKVLDVGCGSGILSIGADLLGAGEVLAIDIDPEAVKVSSENVALNRCSDKVKVCHGNLVEGIDFKADIIVANLMADLVIKLSGHAAKHLNPGGVYISSGILTEKKELVAEAIRDCGFEIAEIRNDGIWCAIAAFLPDVSSKEE